MKSHAAVLIECGAPLELMELEIPKSRLSQLADGRKRRKKNLKGTDGRRFTLRLILPFQTSTKDLQLYYLLKMTDGRTEERSPKSYYPSSSPCVTRVACLAPEEVERSRKEARLAQ